MIIAIDGPAGSGKSTVAKLVAKRTGFLYIDTGAMYRALTLKVIEAEIDPKDEHAVCELAQRTNIDLIPNDHGPIQVLLDGLDVSVAVREPRVTRHVSDIARIGRVRDILVKLQRKLGAERDCIMDGRDIGTAVFPNADRKFYIDAAFDVRVDRRYKDLINLKIKGVSREQVAADLKNRDTIDSTREHSPLKKADDAVFIDTTGMTIDQVVAAVMSGIRPK
ncbi:MAG TPA: (d)CMP kinase [Candidatus Omnitrophota bacterium]|nr:(d)CMP kinase [Candidatus Omnitrophota bacterium]HNQ51224.1 (d)CMP kinase [Candidatus Omnitrophota bacterium]